jgi:hypothetical protein
VLCEMLLFRSARSTTGVLEFMNHSQCCYCFTLIFVFLNIVSGVSSKENLDGTSLGTVYSNV